MHITESLIGKTLEIAYKAGQAILDIYRQPFDVELKPDNSPITIADKSAHQIIADGLSFTQVPLLSEEGIHTPYDIRKVWPYYWLIDPLDGTKEFINRNGDFTVNIALIHNQLPIFGVVYAPVPGMMYWGSSQGSYRLNVLNNNIDFSNPQSFKSISEKLPLNQKHNGFIVLGSRSHMNESTTAFINNLRIKHPELQFISRGSSLKFCTLAEGNADLYPRFSPTMEWDTAAGHAVAAFAGCSVFQPDNQQPLLYNKQSLLNPSFIASLDNA